MLFVVPGCHVGCTPQNLLLQSTLECFYNESCVDLLIAHCTYPEAASVLAMNPSSGYHHPNDTIESFYDQMSTLRCIALIRLHEKFDQLLLSRLDCVDFLRAVPPVELYGYRVVALVGKHPTVDRRGLASSVYPAE